MRRLKRRIFFMKQILIVLAFLSCYTAEAQKPHYGILKKPNEQIVTSFSLAGKGKMVVVCKDSNDAYLVYRFGTPTQIELAYPEVLDTNSWHKFYFWNYHRGGGIMNEGMDEVYLSFVNKGIKYRVYETYYSVEGTSAVGILIKMGDKTIDMPGIYKTQKNGLSDLSVYDDWLPNGFTDNTKALKW